MKTIKIIDLLNKIANGEKVPKKIKIREVDYKFTQISTRNLTFSDSGNNINYAYENDFENYWLDCARINEEVEILDEEDEFEDIEWLDVALLGQCDNWLRCPTKEVTKQDIELNPYIINNIRENTLEFQHRINDLIKNQKKIIDRLNKE